MNYEELIYGYVMNIVSLSYGVKMLILVAIFKPGVYFE